MAILETSKKINKGGLYRHPDTHAEVRIDLHPKFGSATADAFVAAGFVLVDEDEGVAALAEKPLSKMTKAELLGFAELAGVEETEGLTNKELVAAIEAAREKGANE